MDDPQKPRRRRQPLPESANEKVSMVQIRTHYADAIKRHQHHRRRRLEYLPHRRPGLRPGIIRHLTFAPEPGSASHEPMFVERSRSASPRHRWPYSACAMAWRAAFSKSESSKLIGFTRLAQAISPRLAFEPRT